ncbi:MAG: sugar phosphate nucleotidyltransferase [Limnochordia bacterium]|jgi:mannose-1-phosphate guanylyltransferase/phosphomannomutase
MKAVIMAGGQGSRLRPLTCDLAKPMVPVANRPMMEYIIELLCRHGFQDIAVTTYYLPESIEEYFTDGAAWGVKLQYFQEGRPLGTAGSVKNAAGFLDDTFLVISGDCLTDFDLAAAAAYHREKQALATIVLTRVPSPLEYGVVFTSSDGRVERFLEKPSWGEVFSDTVNTGIYILEPEALSHIPAGRQFDFSRDLFPLLLKQQLPLYGYTAQGYWSDIGSLEQYVQSHIDLLAGKVQAAAPGTFQDGVWKDEGAWVHPDAVLEPPVILGKNSRVERGASAGPGTVLGPGSVLGPNSSVRRSILWQNVQVGADGEIRGAVICDQVLVKPRARIFEGAVIGRSSTVGMSSTVRPGVKIWPHKVIERGTSVSTDVVWAGTCSKALFGNAGISGLANLEITPEFAVRVGASLAALHDQQSTILVAADGWVASRMVRRALTTGILSSGVGAVDIGSTTLPAARFTTVLTNCAAGVYVRQGRQSPDHLEIQILDKLGFPLGRGDERKIENYFSRCDFRRVQGNHVGRAQFAAGANEAYLKALLEKCDAALLAQVPITVVIGYTSPALRRLLHTLLERLNCRIIDLDLDKTPGTAPSSVMYQREMYIDQMAEIIAHSGAGLGLLVDGSGEAAIILNDNGQVLPEERHWPLLTWALARTGRGQAKRWAVPVSASVGVDHVAKKYGGSVLRTPNTARAVLQAAGSRAKEDLTLLHPAFDALSFVAVLIQLVKGEGRPLSQLEAAFPAPSRQELAVPVSWEDKGRVMHSLLERTAGRERDLIDGIKVFHEQSWALILPDGEEPVVRVLAEAPAQDEADALAQLYADEITNITGAADSSMDRGGAGLAGQL